MKKLLLGAAIAGIFLAGASGARAGILGDTFEVDYFYPDLATPTETNGFVPAVAGDNISLNGGLNNVAFFDNSIVISLPVDCGGCTLATAAFNGIVVTDLSNPLLTATLNAAGTNFSGFVLNFIGGDIQYNQQGVVSHLGDQLTIDVTTAAPLPEPASMALLGASLLGLGVARRRRA